MPSEPNEICLTIRDDGSGFLPGTPLGFGLSAMRERVKHLSGTLAIAPASPWGTLLTIRIPLNGTRTASG